MPGWTNEELTKMGAAAELQLATRRRDGRLRNPVTIWAVCQGDGVYVRSAVKGPRAAWFRGVQETREGRVWAGGVEKDVTFENADQGIDDEVDAAYQAKYRRYAGPVLSSVLTPEARSTTVKIVPR